MGLCSTSPDIQSFMCLFVEKGKHNSLSILHAKQSLSFCVHWWGHWERNVWKFLIKSKDVLHPGACNAHKEQSCWGQDLWVPADALWPWANIFHFGSGPEWGHWFRPPTSKLLSTSSYFPWSANLFALGLILKFTMLTMILCIEKQLRTIEFGN